MDDFDLIIKLAIGVATAALIFSLHYPLRNSLMNGNAVENIIIRYETYGKWPKWIRAFLMIGFSVISIIYQICLLVIWFKVTIYISNFIVI